MSDNKDDPRALHENRLATTDEHGHRIFLHPSEVTGYFRNWRNVVYWGLIFLYLILPWIYINGKQVLLLDIAKREFYIFGVTFMGHDAPLLIFLFLGITLGFGFLTSIYGRVWCGWGCPQTVFIDAIYRKIEEIVEGKARVRRKLDKDPWSLDKFRKRIIKWILFVLVSLHIGHTFVGYFVGTHRLLGISLKSPADNLTIFITTMVISLIFLIDFGWFREQFCLIACPYGRFQSVMMDEDSMVIIYDDKRGEPRRTVAPDEASEGDCINCYKCVQVCPTGIDIRRGTQLECIQCTQCIDACDEIMDKVKRPRGLIRYASENSVKGVKAKKLHVRTIIYLAALTIVFIGFIISYNKNMELDALFLRGKGAPFSVVGHEHHDFIQNLYSLGLYYQGEQKYKLFFKVKDGVGTDKIILKTARQPYIHEGKGKQSVPVFFLFPQEILVSGSKVITVEILSGESIQKSKLITEAEVTLVGPTN
ncbi:MAG: cytochrome c oxidase accessory protein CcoG [Halobacteriovoraceae bacterium]|nr:cytochrome c oxidase accessory protein CcoG [Halobacteriovoraceae bacterium]